MALNDIDDLPDNPSAGQSGHRTAHQKLHSGLKSVKNELDGRLSDEELNGTYAPWTPKSNLSRTAVLGDSIDAQVAGWFERTCIASGQRMAKYINAGVGGNRTDQMLARLDTDIISKHPDICVFGGATNDHAQGILESVTRANIQAIADALIAARIYPVVRTTPPADAAGVGAFNSIALRRAAIERHNAWLVTWAATRGIPVLDIYTPCVDPATGGFKSGYTVSADGIHPTETVGKLIADYLISKGLPSIFKGSPYLTKSKTDSSNLLSNGVFVGDANTDGAADSWGKVGTGLTPSLVTGDTNIVGNWQRLTTDGTGAHWVQNTLAFSPPLVGRRIELTGRVKATGTATNYQIRAIPVGSSPNTDAMFGFTQPIEGIFRAEFIVPSGATGVTIYLQVSVAAGAVDFSQVTARDITDLIG